jgi:cell division septal protein FtsQ
VFFKVEKIAVKGVAAGSAEEAEVVKASGIELRDDLLLLDTSKVEERLVSEVTFVEEAKVSRRLPDTVVIEITDASDSYNVSCEDGRNLTVSKNGKVLSDEKPENPELPTFVGFDPEEPEVGKMLRSKDEQKDRIFKAVTSVLNDSETIQINSIDMSNKYSIKIKFENRIIFDAGNWYDMDYKITLAQKAISQLDGNATGYINMVGSNQVSFRTRQEAEATERRRNSYSGEG